MNKLLEYEQVNNVCKYYKIALEDGILKMYNKRLAMPLRFQHQKDFVAACRFLMSTTEQYVAENPSSSGWLQDMLDNDAIKSKEEEYRIGCFNKIYSQFQQDVLSGEVVPSKYLHIEEGDDYPIMLTKSAARVIAGVNNYNLKETASGGQGINFDIKEIGPAPHEICKETYEQTAVEVIELASKSQKEDSSAVNYFQ